MGLTVESTTVVVATYGQQQWINLARIRAIPSARALGCQVIHVHGDTIHGARNECVSQVTTPWVIHLDADDQLEPGYITAMSRGTADVRAPMVRYIQRGRGLRPAMPRVAGHGHACTADCLTQGNWLVVGAAVRTDLVREVGGWRDFSWSEDWDLWLRCHLRGAKIEAIPTAVYRAFTRPGSRNRGQSAEARLAAHRAIEQANGLGPGGIRP